MRFAQQSNRPQLYFVITQPSSSSQTVHAHVCWYLSSALQAQVSKLSSRLKEREEQLSEAQDCYSKLDAIYQAEKADIATALSSKVITICPCSHAWHLRSTDIAPDMSALPPSAASCRITVPAPRHDSAHSP